MTPETTMSQNRPIDTAHLSNWEMGMEAEQIGSLNTKFGPAIVMQGHYRTARGPMAVWLESADDRQLIAVISVNAPGAMDMLPADCIYAKTYSENEPLVKDLLASGLFVETDVHLYRVGFDLPIWRVVPAAEAKAA